MDQGPLVTEQLDAGGQLAAEFSKYFRVDLAFWLREGDAGQWYFYLASSEIDDTNFVNAYRHVLAILNSESNLWLEPFQVKVINSEKVPAKNLLVVMNKHPARPMTRIRGKIVDGQYIDEAVVYPSNFQVKAVS